MPISYLGLSNFRNVRESRLSLSPHLNVFYGHNGAGKTSALESIYFALTGKSLRTRIISDYINKSDANAMFAAIKIVFQEGLEVDTVTVDDLLVKVEKGNKARINLINGASAFQGRFSTLTQTSPCFYFSPESLNFISGDPQERRSFVDWLLFHVEHDYRDIYLNYKTALRNRNSVLMQCKREKWSKTESLQQQLTYWTELIINLNKQIDAMRQRHLGAIFEAVQKFVELELGLENVSLRVSYNKGWSIDCVGEAFIANADSEAVLGYTLAGVHKADVNVLGLDSVKGKYIFSRGQTKLVTLAFVIAAANYIFNTRNLGVILLLDDVFSELDPLNSTKLSGIISGLREHQILLTSAVDNRSLFDTLDVTQATDIKLFHVEHGEFIEEKMNVVRK